MHLTTPERWRRIEQLLDAALELPPAERAALLDGGCAGDPELRAEVDALLQACDSAEHFLERPAGLAAPLVARLAGEAMHADSLPPGTRIGAYRIVGEAGRGGMGVVYAAERDDGEFRKRVALKLVATPRGRRAVDAERRFREERQILASLEHPGIVRLLDGGVTEEGCPWLVMEYVEGAPVDRYCDEHRLDIAARLELFCRVCDAVQHAHENGIIHRDIKPSNILVSERGEVRLLDFGIAKLMVTASDEGDRAADPATATQPGLRLLTPDYASPEQLRGEPVSAASDVYSLGVVLYGLLCGRHPHRRTGDSRGVVEHRILHEPLARPSDVVKRGTEAPAGGGHEPLTPERIAELRRCTPARLRRALRGNLDAIALAALRTEPARRCSSAGELAAELRRHLAGHAVRTRADGVAVHLRAFVRRHPAGALAAAGALALTVGAASTLRSPGSSASPASSASSAPEHATTLAILPFTASAAEPALDRLGRDLAGTLGASLNGIGQLRTLEARTGGAGARVVISGSLARAGERVRADLLLRTTDGSTSPALLSLPALPADLALLTDSLTLALVRELWRAHGAPTPSPAAVTTRSPRALRAYVEGEGLLDQFRLGAAAAAFRRAIAADSTFWYAYWRYAWTRELGALPVDSAIVATYLAHRADFPEPDRLLVEARRAGTLPDRRARLRALTERFPDYWPGWFELGELDVRQGPFAGGTLADASRPLLSSAALHPDFIPAWDRLLWIAIARRDTVASRRALGELQRLRYGAISLADDRIDMLQLYRNLDHLSRAAGAGGRAHRDSVAVLVADSLAAITERSFVQRGHPGSPDGMPEKFQGGIARYGFHAARIALAERTLRSRAGTQSNVAFQWRVIATGWASRGAWDVGLAAADRAVDANPKPVVALFAYRLAVIGAWLQAVEPAAALARRDRVERTLEPLAPADRAELAWVDGLLAATRRDGAAMARARAALRVLEVPGVRLLDSSLAALQLELAGDRRHARELLVALERDRYYLDNGHPYLTGVNRMTASRWLVAAGDTLEAARLLGWHEAVLYPAPQTVHANALLAAFAYRELGRILAARGQAAEARAAYAQFLTRYDATDNREP